MPIVRDTHDLKTAPLPHPTYVETIITEGRTEPETVETLTDEEMDHAAGGPLIVNKAFED